MDDIFLMQVFKPYNDVCDEEFGFRLWKFSLTADMIAQVSTIQVIHHQI